MGASHHKLKRPRRLTNVKIKTTTDEYFDGINIALILNHNQPLIERVNSAITDYLGTDYGGGYDVYDNICYTGVIDYGAPKGIKATFSVRREKTSRDEGCGQVYSRYRDMDAFILFYKTTDLGSIEYINAVLKEIIRYSVRNVTVLLVRYNVDTFHVWQKQRWLSMISTLCKDVVNHISIILFILYEKDNINKPEYCVNHSYPSIETFDILTMADYNVKRCLAKMIDNYIENEIGF